MSTIQINSIRMRFLIGLGIATILGSVAIFVFIINRYHLYSWDLLTSNFAWFEIYEHVIVPMGIFIVLLVIGAYVVVRDIEKRLRETAREIRNSAQLMQPYQGHVDELPAEIRPLISAYNDLNTQLEKHSRRQQAFAADAAHELKTPLAVMALEIDKVPAKYTQGLREQIQGLSLMIDQLLLLARSNSKHAGAAGPLVDPVKIGKGIVELLAPKAIESGVTLSFEARDPAPFHGLEEAVSAAVRTLVINAIRVTPKGGSVTVHSGPGPAISVIDEGPSLDAETLERVKARGVRGDMADSGDAGLGLAIADRIAEAHGGELLTCMPDMCGLKLVFPDRPHISMTDSIR